MSDLAVCEAFKRITWMLYGLPCRASVKMARKLGVAVRFYVPHGKAWLPYLLKQARKNPRVLGWFARDLVRGYTA